jgi:hypothetical protein
MSAPTIPIAESRRMLARRQAEFEMESAQREYNARVDEAAAALSNWFVKRREFHEATEAWLKEFDKRLTLESVARGSCEASGSDPSASGGLPPNPPLVLFAVDVEEIRSSLTRDPIDNSLGVIH